MIRRGVVNQRFVAVFLLSWLLLGFPLLALFDRPETISGIPLLVVYLSTAWIALIVLLAAIVERRRVEPRRFATPYLNARPSHDPRHDLSRTLRSCSVSRSTRIDARRPVAR